MDDYEGTVLSELHDFDKGVSDDLKTFFTNSADRYGYN